MCVISNDILRALWGKAAKWYSLKGGHFTCAHIRETILTINIVKISKVFCANLLVYFLFVSITLHFKRVLSKWNYTICAYCFIVASISLCVWDSSLVWLSHLSFVLLSHVPGQMCHDLFLHSPTDEHLDCSWFFTITKKDDVFIRYKHCVLKTILFSVFTTSWKSWLSPLIDKQCFSCLSQQLGN